MSKFKVILSSLICFSFCLTVQAVAPDIGTDEQRAAGKILYDKKCSQCHGMEGDGRGIAYRFTKPWPRNFTMGIYKFKSTPDDRLPTTEDIVKTIRNGNPYTAMPAWPDFTDGEVLNLAYYIKAFSEDFSDPDSLEDPDIAPIPMEIPSSAPSWSQESADKGKPLFDENKCVDCHGPKGRGSGTSALEAQDMDENQIRPRDMTKPWTFRSGNSRLDIFRTLTMGRSPMPSFHTLSAEQRWNLVDYVYSFGPSQIPEYSTVVLAQYIEGDLTLSEEGFKNSSQSRFPLVGQITQPGRAFFASANSIEVKSIYNNEDVAFMLSWHDMAQEVTNTNSPDAEASVFDMASTEYTKEEPAQFSDAVAIQIPTEASKGVKKPYFIFGDSKLSVDLWFSDLSDSAKALVYQANGAKKISVTDQSLSFSASFDNGRWTAFFKRSRVSEGGTSFNEKEFTPIAFSVWDGFNNERGNKRALSEWFHVYLKPIKEESIIGKIILTTFIFVLLELLVCYFVRRNSLKKI